MAIRPVYNRTSRRYDSGDVDALVKTVEPFEGIKIENESDFATIQVGDKQIVLSKLMAGFLGEWLSNISKM